MNIVVAGPRVQVYGEDVKTYKQLPIGSYGVCFDKMTGFFLTPRHDLEAKETKVYGNHNAKVEKVLKSFKVSDRNFGIILSGQKGIGKSLFARILAEGCIEQSVPVITVDTYYPGVSDFISSIEQEVCIIFDEFEKTFGKTDDYDPQEEMLTLFDGMDNGKKLFVITCNEVNRLNPYLVNRPGRFHYHFSISSPSKEEVEEYMKDKLFPEYYDLIPRITNFAQTVNITYDYLRAIAFEINQGYSIEETLGDLNISRTTDVRFNIKLTLVNGDTYVGYDASFDLYSKKVTGYRLYSSNFQRNDSLCFNFCPRDIYAKDGQLVLDPDKVKINSDYEDYWDLEGDAKAEAIAKEKERLRVKSCIFQKQDNDFVLRYAV